MEITHLTPFEFDGTECVTVLGLRVEILEIIDNAIEEHDLSVSADEIDLWIPETLEDDDGRGAAGAVEYGGSYDAKHRLIIGSDRHKYLGMDAIEGTVLHELAHIENMNTHGPEFCGHGPRWEEINDTLGGSGKFAQTCELPEYLVHCEDCNHIIWKDFQDGNTEPAHRKYPCEECGGNVIQILPNIDRDAGRDLGLLSESHHNTASIATPYNPRDADRYWEDYNRNP